MGVKFLKERKKKLKTIWLYKLVLTFKCNRCVFLHYLCEYVCNNPSQKKWCFIFLVDIWLIQHQIHIKSLCKLVRDFLIHVSIILLKAMTNVDLYIVILNLIIRKKINESVRQKRREQKRIRNSIKGWGKNFTFTTISIRCVGVEGQNESKAQSSTKTWNGQNYSFTTTKITFWTGCSSYTLSWFQAIKY